MNTYFLIVVPFVLLAEVILLPQVRLDYTGPRIVLSSGVLCTEYTSLGLGHRGTTEWLGSMQEYRAWVKHSRSINNVPFSARLRKDGYFVRVPGGTSVLMMCRTMKSKQHAFLGLLRCGGV